MSIAVISLIALLIVLVISLIWSYNVGLLALALAFIVTQIGGMPLKELFGSFPTHLFIMLVGVTYFFGIAETNGTIDIICKASMRFIRGKKGLIPVVLFMLAAVVGGAGAGSIAAVAMLAPLAMGLASRMKMHPLLAAMGVAYGALSTTLVPFSATGVIFTGILKNIGISGVSWIITRNLIIECFIIFGIGYVLFGGLTLWKNEGSSEDAASTDISEFIHAKFEIKRANILTFIAMGLLVVLAIYNADSVGLYALMMGVVLTLLKCADEQIVIKAMPWNVILMINGVAVLVSIMSKTGGTKIFEDMIIQISNENTVYFITTFIPALFSAYASTLLTFTAFFPIIPGVAQAVGADPVALISGIAAGATIVDVSPLSTIGALLLGATTAEMDKSKLFNQMLIWGISMSVIGATISWILYGLIGL